MSTGRRMVKRRIKRIKRSVENIANNLMWLQKAYQSHGLVAYSKYLEELQKLLFTFLAYLEKFEELV